MHNSTHVNLEIEDSFFQTYGISETGFVEMTRKNPDVLFTMLQVFKELQAADGCSATSIQMLLLDFLHQSKNRNSAHKIPSWIILIRDILHDNWQGAVNLKNLSQEVDVHPVSISHYFPKYFSCTLGAYMRKLKIEHAISLLKSTDCSLTDVTYECGFFDQSHFIRTFKQLTGFLPAHYQKL